MLEILMKHAKNFVLQDDEKDETRKKLKEVNFYSDGSVIALNPHYGFKAMNVHEDEVEHRRNTNGKKVADDVFPLNKIMSLIQSPQEVEEQATFTMNIDVEGLQSFVSSVNKLDTPSESINELLFEFTDKGMEARYITDAFKGVFRESEKAKGDPQNFALDAKKLQFLLDLANEIGFSDLKLYYRGLAKPIELRSYDDRLRLVIMQLRLYKQ